MARSALTQLQSQIEAIRREAYAAGYAAAMQVIQKAVSGGPAGAAPRRRAAAPKPAAAAKPAPVAKPARAAKPAQAAKAPARRGRPAKVAAPKAPARRGRPAKVAAPKASSRPRRGNNAAMIEEILKGIAPRAARAAEIRAALQRDKGAALAFTSIRHALGQLASRQVIEEVGDSKSWRMKG
jgi:hypothetical protein